VPAYNKQNTDAPFVDMAQLKLWKEIVVVAQCFLPQVGIAPTGARNELLIAPFGASFDSGKKHCGVLLIVSRNWHSAFNKEKYLWQRSFISDLQAPRWLF